MHLSSNWNATFLIKIKMLNLTDIPGWLTQWDVKCQFYPKNNTSFTILKSSSL